MEWRHIRLELAPTEAYPSGSASRAYLLHLPLDEDGRVDVAALESMPRLARVRRHWPNEADRSGYMIRTARGWTIARRAGDTEGGSVLDLDDCSLRVGNLVSLTDGDGRQLAFRIVSLG